jgi:hypothetical protein
LKAAAAASKEARSILGDVKVAEELSKEVAAKVYIDLTEARRAHLLAGVEVPEVPLPAGWTVQLRPGPQIVEPSEVPRELCAPDRTRVKEAWKRRPCGTDIPGTKTVEAVIFTRGSK